jgi:hypothetical protein
VPIAPSKTITCSLIASRKPDINIYSRDEFLTLFITFHFKTITEAGFFPCLFLTALIIVLFITRIFTRSQAGAWEPALTQTIITYSHNTGPDRKFQSRLKIIISRYIDLLFMSIVHAHKKLTPV